MDAVIAFENKPREKPTWVMNEDEETKRPQKRQKKSSSEKEKQTKGKLEQAAKVSLETFQDKPTKPTNPLVVLNETGPLTEEEMLDICFG